MSAAEKQEPWDEFRDMPALLTPEQAAQVLNISRKALYTRKERGQLAGVVQTAAKQWRVRKAILLRSLVPQGHATAPANGVE